MQPPPPNTVIPIDYFVAYYIDQLRPYFTRWSDLAKAIGRDEETVLTIRREWGISKLLGKAALQPPPPFDARTFLDGFLPPRPPAPPDRPTP